MELIVATNNQGKVREFKDKLQNFEVFSLKDKGIVIEVEEDGTTFEENAIKKARAVCELTGKMTIADDSGLEVFALDNAPGIYSARYGGEGLSDEQRYIKLLEDMENKTDRGARFVSVIAICWPDGRDVTLRGECYGEILKAPMGDGGFGYDPVFYYPPLSKTFGDLTLEEKNQVSHRARALEKLERFFAGQNVVIENGVLRAEIASCGAEMRKLTNAKGEDLLNTHFASWDYASPVLFPIVGKCRDKKGYYCEGKYYEIPPHGFARNMEFLLVHASENEAIFVLEDNEFTLKQYPFAFRLYVCHKLVDNKWKITYKVENKGNKVMPFSIGSHEAYSISPDWENYEIEFEKEENIFANRLRRRGYQEKNVCRNYGKAEKKIPVFKDGKHPFFFAKNLVSSWVQLNYKGKPIVRVHYDVNVVKSVGLWRMKKGNFFCLEPWLGIPDGYYTSSNIEEKEFYTKIQPGEQYENTHEVEFFL